MASVAVLIPVLNRPWRVAPLLESLAASGLYTRLTPWFLVSPCDRAELDALRNVPSTMRIRVVPWEPGPGDYARKINWGARVAARDHEFLFLGADDLHFHPGWAERALAAHQETGACVIGTNDGGNALVQAGGHSTHSLVHRDYLECGTVDEPGLILHEGYDHQWVDNEFVGTARWRATFVAATDSLVEHLHPFWGKAETDATYTKALRAEGPDRALYNARRRLWGGA